MADLTIAITTTGTRSAYLTSTLGTLQAAIAATYPDDATRPDIHVLCEPGGEPPPIADSMPHLHWHTNLTRLGNFGNWYNAATNMFRLASAGGIPYVLTLEDDIVISESALTIALQLMRQRFAHRRIGVMSLYTSGAYQRRWFVPGDGPDSVGYSTLREARDVMRRVSGGMLERGQRPEQRALPEGLHELAPTRLWGACAWLFQRDTLRQVINHGIMANWGPESLQATLRQRQYQPRRASDQDMSSTVGVDVALGMTLQALQLPMLFFQPSLVQHIGARSTIGNDTGLTTGRTARDWLG